MSNIRPFWKNKEDEVENKANAHEVQYGFSGENGRGAPGNMETTGDSQNLVSTEGIAEIPKENHPVITDIAKNMPEVSADMNQNNQLDGQNSEEENISEGTETEAQEVYGPQPAVPMTREMLEALTMIKSGNIQSVPDSVLKQIDQLAEISPGMAAALGVLTDENWEQFAYLKKNGEWQESNNRVAYNIYSDNYGILGDELSKYAIKLNDPSFPPELYDDAVRVLLTIIRKAELSAKDNKNSKDDAGLRPNQYQAYYENHKDDFDFMVLNEVFDFEDELKAKRREELKAQGLRGAEEYLAACERCRTGKGTIEDYAFVYGFVPDLTPADLEKDKGYNRMNEKIRQARISSDVSGDESDWYNTQALEYMSMHGMGTNLYGAEAQIVKDKLTLYEYGAVEQLTETAIKLNYKSLDEYMDATGIGMDTIRMIAVDNMRRNEKNAATPENAKAMEKAVYQGDGSASFFEVAMNSFLMNVDEQLAEGYEALHTWLETTNTEADAARALAIYTKEYGRYGGEKELGNQLLDMSEEGYFPNDGLNKFVGDYIRSGGNPFALGIVPGDFGYIVKEAKKYRERADDYAEWSRESLSEVQGLVFDWAAYKSKDYMQRALTCAIRCFTGGGLVSELFSLMMVYGPEAYNSGIKRAVDEGYGLGDIGKFGATESLAAALSNYELEKKLYHFAKTCTGKAALENAIDSIPLNETETWWMKTARIMQEYSNRDMNGIERLESQVLGEAKTKLYIEGANAMTKWMIGELDEDEAQMLYRAGLMLQ